MPALTGEANGADETPVNIKFETTELLINKKDYDYEMISDFWDYFRVNDPLSLGYFPEVSHIHERLDVNKTMQDIMNNQEVYNICLPLFKDIILSPKKVVGCVFIFNGNKRFIIISKEYGKLEIFTFEFETEQSTDVAYPDKTKFIVSKFHTLE